MRRLFVLVGPKGAGKTHTGGVLERRGVVRFVRVAWFERVAP